MPTEEILKKASTLSFPKGSQVYFLMLGEQIVYVGKSDSLLSRVGTHQKDKVFNSVKYLDVVKADQDLLEMALIKALRPQYNLQKSGKLTKAESEILSRFAFEDAVIHAAVRSQPKARRESYGFVGFFVGTKLITGLYDDEDDFEDSDHTANCRYIKAKKELGKLTEDQNRGLLEFCRCHAKSVIKTDFHSYYCVPLDEVYDLEGVRFRPFRQKFEEKFLAQIKELQDGRKEA